MLIALAVVTGFEHSVKEKLYSFSGHVHVIRFDPMKSFSRTTAPIYASPELLSAIGALPHVQQVFAFAERPVIVQAKGNMEGIALKGVGKSYRFPAAITITGNTVAYPDSGYSKDIMLSDVLAERLSVAIGDTVQIEFFEGGGLPRVRRVRISGLFHTGMAEVDKHYAIADIGLIQRLNNWTSDSINAIQVDLDDERFADTTANVIYNDLINPPLSAFTTAENYPAIFEWLGLQKTNSNILLLIMGIVAIINLGSVLVILMVDRTVMIALLKTLGMTFRDTVRIFLSIGFILGGAGILLGNLLFIALAVLQERYHFITLQEDVYYMKYAPIKLVWWHVAATDLVCLLLLTICMWLPALYIRTIQPAKALQFR